MGTKKILQQPYPQPENNWVVIISISCFISLFILIFQPFQLSQLQGGYRHLTLAGYGGVTFLALVLNMLLIPRLFRNIFTESKWTVKRQILYFLWILFTIGIGNYFYTLAITDFFSLSMHGILLFQFYTVAIGIFPISFLVIFTQNRLFKKNLEMATDMNIALPFPAVPVGQPTVTLLSNGKDSVYIDAVNLLYIEAMGNYLKVHILGNEVVKKEIIRCTLKEAEKATDRIPQIVRCHRAFIVNLLHVQKAEGNAQGYLLKLKGTDNEVPVSRKYIATLKQQLDSLKREKTVAVRH